MSEPTYTCPQCGKSFVFRVSQHCAVDHMGACCHQYDVPADDPAQLPPASTTRDLAALEDAAEKACRAAYRVRKRISGAINWADLHVVTAERVEELYRGELRTFYRVWIEEANEDCPELSGFIYDWLTKQGYPEVEVRTQW